MTLEPIDLMHMGLERIIGVYVAETRRRPRALRLRPLVHDRRAQGRARRARPRAAGHPPPAALAHPPRPRRRSRHARPRAPAPPGARLADRRAARRRPDAARAQRPPALRRRASTRSGARSSRCRRQNVHAVDGSAAGLEVFPTPGHASHHVSYLTPDGTLHAGDAVGVRIVPGSYVFPAAPPPDVDLEGWERTFDAIESRRPARFALTHFGVVEDTEEHLARMREELATAAERVRSGMSQEEFEAATRADVDSGRRSRRGLLRARRPGLADLPRPQALLRETQGETGFPHEAPSPS